MSAVVGARVRRLLAAPGSAALVFAAVLLSGCDGSSSARQPEHPGQSVYQRHCFACHQSGIADAPVLGDGDAWASRMQAGRQAMLDNVIQGMPPGMPARGACATCSDEELGLAVDFIIERAR